MVWKAHRNGIEYRTQSYLGRKVLGRATPKQIHSISFLRGVATPRSGPTPRERRFRTLPTEIADSGPRSTRPLGKRGLHPQLSLTTPAHLHFTQKIMQSCKMEIGHLEDSIICSNLAVSLRATLANRGRKNAIRSANTIYRGRTNRYFQINTSELL